MSYDWLRRIDRTRVWTQSMIVGPVTQNVSHSFIEFLHDDHHCSYPPYHISTKCLYIVALMDADRNPFGSPSATTPGQTNKSPVQVLAEVLCPASKSSNAASSYRNPDRSNTQRLGICSRITHGISSTFSSRYTQQGLARRLASSRPSATPPTAWRPAGGRCSAAPQLFGRIRCVVEALRWRRVPI